MKMIVGFQDWSRQMILLGTNTLKKTLEAKCVFLAHKRIWAQKTHLGSWVTLVRISSKSES